jgi:hypothetical protein
VCLCTSHKIEPNAKTETEIPVVVAELSLEHLRRKHRVSYVIYAVYAYSRPRNLVEFIPDFWDITNYKMSDTETETETPMTKQQKRQQYNEKYYKRTPTRRTALLKRHICQLRQNL